MEKRYSIETELGRGGMGVVFVAFDRLRQERVALKRIRLARMPVKPDPDETVGEDQKRARPADRETEPATLDEASLSPFPIGSIERHLRTALTREFRMLASLRHPRIVSVLDYGFDEKQQPFFTMEWLSDAKPMNEVESDLTGDQKIEVITQLIEALCYLNRHGIIHRDIKPGNVLVEVDGDVSVKLLDFGISLGATEVPSAGDVIGTRVYMAPELFGDGSPGTQSEIYALGVLALRLLTGVVSDPSGFDFSTLPVTTELQELIERMVAWEPSARPADPNDLLGLWTEAVAAVDPSSDTEATPHGSEHHDSLFRAARFVCRDAEMATLTETLELALSGTTGSLWLIEGPSGIGKSRLLEELQATALISGMRVLQGEAVEGARGVFQLWRDVLRSLSLIVEPRPLHEQVIKGLVPELEAILDKSIPDAPRVSPVSNRDRIIDAVHSCLEQLDEPTLVTLEDIHWANHESLELLKQLAGLTETQPLVIVATTRDADSANGEGDSALLDEIPGVKHIRLASLDRDALTTLSRTMMGDAIDHRDLVSVLEDHAQGNPFHAIEIIRAAMEAGPADLPDSELELHTILGQRIAELPDDARELVELAAVCGRVLELPLLQRCYAGAIDPWLHVCSEARIIESHHGRWRFVHDALRDIVLAGLSREETSGIHARVAEQVQYLDDTDARSADLAFHFDAAGMPEHAIEPMITASERALDNGAPRESISLAKRALELAESVSIPPEQHTIALSTIIQAQYALGELDGAIETTGLLREELGLRPVAEGRLSRVLALARQLVRLPWSWRATPRARRRYPRSVYEWTKASETFAYSFMAYSWMQQPYELVFTMLSCLNFCMSHGMRNATGGWLGGLGAVFSTTPLRRYNDALYGKALQLAVKDSTRTFIKLTQSVFLMQEGRWTDAGELFDELRANAHITGHKESLLFALVQSTTMHYFCGDLDAARVVIEQLQPELAWSKGLRHKTWYQHCRGLVELGEGRYEAAASAFTIGLEAGIESKDVFPEIDNRGGLALALLMQGHADEAYELARENSARIKDSRNVGYSGVTGTPSTVEVLIDAWQHSGRESDARLVEAMLGFLKAEQRLYPIHRPLYAFFRGRYARLRGRRGEARRYLDRSLQAARDLKAGAEQARAALERALLAEDVGDEEGRQQYAAMAADLAAFTRAPERQRFSLELPADLDVPDV